MSRHRETGLAAILLAAMIPTSASPASHVWSYRFGHIYHDLAQSVALDASGNVFITGQFAYVTDLGGGPMAGEWHDIFLAKYDANGSHVWSQRFGGASVYDYGRSVAVDAMGNVFLTGDFEETVDFGGGSLVSIGDEDIFLAKYDPNGVHLWSRRFGSAVGDRGNAVASDASGNVFMTGHFERIVDFGGTPLASEGSKDMFLAKYDSDGNHIWSRSFGIGLEDHGFAIVADGAGGALVCGDYYEYRNYPPPWHAEQILVRRYDASGGLLWSREFGGSRRDVAFAATLDADGNAVVTGAFQDTVDFGGGPKTSAGNSDAFLVKYDSKGTHLWSQRFGGESWDQGFSVAADPTAGVWLTGEFRGTADFGGDSFSSAGLTDIFLAHYDANGSHLSSRSFGSGETDVPSLVVADGVGDAVVTGYFMGSVDFGGGVLTSAGSPDIFLAKYSDDVAVAIDEFNAAGSSRLGQNMPNPFNPGTHIPFSISDRARVIVSVHDVAGNLVRVLLDAERAPGTYRAEWDGRDARGVPVVSGVYFCRLRAGKFTDSKKMLLVK